MSGVPTVHVLREVALSTFGCRARVGSDVTVPSDAQATCADHRQSIGMRLSAVAIMANDVGCIRQPRQEGRASSGESVTAGNDFDWTPPLACRMLSGMRRSVDGKRLDVVASDLKDLPAIHALLATLTDPHAPVARLDQQVANIPILAERCRHEARRFGKAPPTLAQALAGIGNGGLERVLLGLLEDLTVLDADIKSQGD